MDLAEFGLAGAILAILLPLFVWVVRRDGDRAEHVTSEFTKYLQQQGNETTRVLTQATEVQERTGHTLGSIAKGLDHMIQSSERHDDRAQRRHEDMLTLVRGMFDELKTKLNDERTVNR